MDWTIHIETAARTVDRIFREVPGKVGLRHAMSGAKALLPYALHPVDDMPEVWIWLNREYKPLGTSSGWVDYRAYTSHHIRRDDLRIKRLLPACNPIWNGDAYFLFNDLTSPFVRYGNAVKYANLIRLIDWS